jgi:hypothetical protein
MLDDETKAKLLLLDIRIYEHCLDDYKYYYVGRTAHFGVQWLDQYGGAHFNNIREAVDAILPVLDNKYHWRVDDDFSRWTDKRLKLHGLKRII